MLLSRRRFAYGSVLEDSWYMDIPLAVALGNWFAAANDNLVSFPYVILYSKASSDAVRGRHGRDFGSQDLVVAVKAGRVGATRSAVSGHSLIATNFVNYRRGTVQRGH